MCAEHTLLWCCRSFIRQFEERPSGQAVDPEADSTRVQAFLAQSERAFRAHPVWRGCQPEVLDQAVEVSKEGWQLACACRVQAAYSMPAYRTCTRRQVMRRPAGDAAPGRAPRCAFYLLPLRRAWRNM